MFLFFRSIAYGTIIGAAFGLIMGIAGFFESSSEGISDKHGYATIAFILIFAVMGALFGLAAGTGAYVKKKFKGESK